MPLYRHTEITCKSAGALIGALVIGSVTAILSKVLVARSLGGDRELWLSIVNWSVGCVKPPGVEGNLLFELGGGTKNLTAKIFRRLLIRRGIYPRY